MPASGQLSPAALPIASRLPSLSLFRRGPASLALDSSSFAGTSTTRTRSRPHPYPPCPAPATCPSHAENNSLAADEGLILEFITESTEHLVTIESQMLLLEKDSAESETLNAVFRGFHTIKGLAGFLEFAAIQSLAHEVETILDLARNGQLAVTPIVVDAILESTDVVRRELDAISKRLAGKAFPPSGVTQDLLERIRSAAAGQSADRSSSRTKRGDSRGTSARADRPSRQPPRFPLLRRLSQRRIQSK